MRFILWSDSVFKLRSGSYLNRHGVILFPPESQNDIKETKTYKRMPQSSLFHKLRMTQTIEGRRKNPDSRKTKQL